MTDESSLSKAVELAQQSSEEVGCGVVIVTDGIIIGQAFNSQSADNITVNHAEIKALTAANIKTGSRKLDGAIAYCSCEPCAMCIAALSYAKVSRIVFNKTMSELFPGDIQSKFDAVAFANSLNFVPMIEQLRL